MAKQPISRTHPDLIAAAKKRNLSSLEAEKLCKKAGEKYAESSKTKDEDRLDAFEKIYDLYVITEREGDIKGFVSRLKRENKIKFNAKTHDIAILMRVYMIDDRTDNDAKNVNRWANILAYHLEEGTPREDLKKKLAEKGGMTEPFNIWRARHGKSGRNTAAQKMKLMKKFVADMNDKLCGDKEKMVRATIVYYPDGDIKVLKMNTEELDDYPECTETAIG